MSIKPIDDKAPKWYEQETFGAFWEQGYRDEHISSMGGPSHEVMEVAQVLHHPAKVLDLGCGEGRNSLFMASLGHEVVSVDRSEAGIAKLQRLADRYHLSVQGIVQDITQFIFDDEYDVVMGHGILYYLERPAWQALLRQVKMMTKPGGFNIYTVFMYDDEYPCTDEIRSAKYLGSLNPLELRDFYDDWGQYRYDQYVKWDSHPGIPIHYHPIEKLVARKPGGDEISLRTESVNSTKTITQEQFHAIPMGMPVEQLLALIGEPDVVDRYTARGVQYNSSTPAQLASNQLVTDKFDLELWYYQKHVMYIVHQEVVGRAIFRTAPVRLVASVIS